MATKQKKQDDSLGPVVIAMVAVTVIFSLYHFVQQKRRYITGPHVRRVFDMENNWRAMVETAMVGLVVLVFAVVIEHNWSYSIYVLVPLGLYLLNWVGKAQANVFLGVLVDSQKGEVILMASPDNLDITDYLMVLPVLRNYTALDHLPLDSIQWITRQAGKSLFLHGDFGSRRIDFSNKLKRDECIHLITSGRRIKMLTEFE